MLKSKIKFLFCSVLIQHFEADFQPQNPEFRNNPLNFHPCMFGAWFFRQIVLELCS